MTILVFVCLVASGWLPLSAAWNCDARCPLAAYLVCLEEEAGNKMRKLEKTSTETIKKSSRTTRDNASLRRPRQKLLRGSSHSHRRLQSTFFQLKLYHEAGYCWQAEWEDRMWCAECKDDCDDWDYLELKFCEWDEDKQYFSYEPMPNGVGGRIKPMTNSSLCWERTRVNAHQLRPCDDINGVVNETQIFRDFDLLNKFELHPFNRGDNTTHPDGPMCLTNHHHPKSEEVIRAETCVGAREDKSSFWEAYNVYTEGGTNSIETPSPSFEPSAAPSLTDATNTETETTPPTKAPVDPTASPVDPIASPVDPPPAPIVPKSIETPSPSSEPSTAPSLTDATTTETETTPPTKAPVDPTASPVDPTPAPVVPTGAPVSPTPDPTANPSQVPTSSPIETASPTDSTSAPIAPTTAPVDPTLAHVNSTAASVDPMSAPVNPPTELPNTQEPTLAPVSDEPGQEKDEGIPVLDMGWDGCSVFDKCPQCVGDCDNDDECEGSLICYKRSGGSSVPTCKGGDAIRHEKDFCIPPDWNTR